MGVSDISDIYLSLIAIPDSILILVGFDTIKGVVNSEYSSLDANSNYLKDSFRNLFTYLFFASLVLVLFLTFFNDYVITLLLPGFSLTKKEIALNLSLLIFPILFFKGINSLFSAYYNSSRRFYFPVATQVVITASIIISIFLPFIHNQLIYNLSLGLLIGNFLYTVILLVPIINTFGLKLFDFKLNSLSKKILKNCFSLVVLVIFNQIYLSSRNFLSSYFPDGSLSALNYASSVTNFISALTFSVIFSVLLSTFANSFSLGERIKVRANFINTLSYLLYAYIPIVIIFVIFAQEILSLLFLRGMFDQTGIELTAKPFLWESLALIPFLFSIIPTTLFLAKKKYKELTLIGISVYVTGIFLSVMFSYIFGFYGVSVASFATYCIHAFFLMKYSRTFVGRYSGNDFILYGKLMLSGILTYILVYIIKFFFEFNLAANLLYSISYLLAGFIVVLLIYFIVTALLNVNLFKKLKNFIQKK